LKKTLGACCHTEHSRSTLPAHQGTWRYTTNKLSPAADGPAGHALALPTTSAPAFAMEKRKKRRGEGKEQKAARKRRISSPLWVRTEKASTFSALPSSRSLFTGPA